MGVRIELVDGSVVDVPPGLDPDETQAFVDAEHARRNLTAAADVREELRADYLTRVADEVAKGEEPTLAEQVARAAIDPTPIVEALDAVKDAAPIVAPDVAAQASVDAEGN